MNELTKESQLIDAYRIYQTEFFKLTNKKKFNVFEFSSEYQFMKFMLVQQKSKTLKCADFLFASTRAQYDLITFLGLDGKQPTHEVLDNPNAFAALLGMLIRRDEFPSRYLDKIRDAIHTHCGRRDDLTSRNLWFYAVEETAVCFNAFTRRYAEENIQSAKTLLDTNLLKRQFKSRCSALVKKTIDSSVNSANQSLKKRLSQNRLLRCYRGFNVRRDEDVRLNRHFSENDQCYVQVGGVGISYTLDKRYAIKFAVHPFIGENEIGNYQRRVDVSSLLQLGSFTDGIISKPTDRIGYVGIVETSVEDIFLNLSVFIENEVLILPENTRLIRYDTVCYKS